MTREELVNNREYQFTKALLEAMNKTYPTNEYLKERDGFDMGAKWGKEWAGIHPNWHKFPEEKPKRNDDYIVAFNNGNVFVAHYNVNKDHWYDKDIANNLEISDIIAWMEFPKSPKFD